MSATPESTHVAAGWQPPIYLAGEKPGPAEDDPISFTLAGNGLWKHRSTELFTATVPAIGVPGVDALKPSIRWKHPLPAFLIERAVGFFDTVATEHPGAEAIVLIAWSRTHRVYRLVVPPQVAQVAVGPAGVLRPVSVQYRPEPLPADLILVGDLHSHAGAAAGESSTDVIDVRYRDGVHTVFGSLGEPRHAGAEAGSAPDVCASVQVDGFRFVMEDPVRELFPGYFSARFDFPSDWPGQIRVETAPWYAQQNQTPAVVPVRKPAQAHKTERSAHHD